MSAFADYSSHFIHYFDMDSGPFDFDLEFFDCIIFNYCFWARCLSLPSDFCRRLSSFTGLKIAILQDEYEYFIWHERTLIACNFQIIVTCVPATHWSSVFRDDSFRQVTFLNALTGYVSDSILDQTHIKPLVDRDWVLGYRSRPVPYIYGRLTQEKVLIGKKMKQFCLDRGVPANIEVTEESRIYGRHWPKFLGNCRAVLGTESGSNVFDFDGSIKKSINSFLEANPDADFEIVHEKFLQGRDELIHMNQVSPRIFEAIAMKTGLVLFEGSYSNVVRPWDHYIPLKKDFSNIDDVFTALSDLPNLEKMIHRAYDDIIVSGRFHFRTFVSLLDSYIANSQFPGKGYQLEYCLFATRLTSDSSISHTSGLSSSLITSRPFRHFDKPSSQVLTFCINWYLLNKILMSWYQAVLYSSIGQKLQLLLRRNQSVYLFFRNCVRRITGRY